MAITRIKGKQLEPSTAPGAILASDTSNNFVVKNPTTGADTIWFYDDSVTALAQLTIGTNLSITGTTLNASAGAGGYAEVQEEGSALTARTKLNFVGGGFTAADDAGNTRTNVTLDATLNALAAYNTNGILTQTAADTFTGRTITGTASRITLTDGDGVAGNPTIDISSSYVGQASITTLGTITTGVWTGTTIAAANGGTGQSTYAVGDLLSANTTSTLSRVAAVASGSVLKSAGVSTLPVWGTLASTDLSNSSNIALLNATQTFTGTNTFSNNITINGTPSASTDAATVGYVTTVVAGLRKGSVRAATTAAGTLASSFENGDSIDGVTLATGDLILIKDQAAPAENGVYTVNASGAPTRATWMDAASEIDGVYVAVEDGTTLAGTLWITVSEVTTLNTDSIVFTQIQTSGSIGGSIAAGQVGYGSGVNTLTSTSTFLFDGTRLSINDASPAASTILNTKGSGTGSATFGHVHKNSSGTTAFTLADDGTLVVGTSSPLTISSSTISRSGNIDITPTAILRVNAPTQTGVGYSHIGSATTLTSQANFVPTAGSGSMVAIGVTGTVNQTGTASQDIIGIDVAHTLTAVLGTYTGLKIAAAGNTALRTTAGFVRFDLGSDANYDMFTRSSAGNLERIANGTTGQVLTATTGSAPAWAAASSGTATRAYLTGSTSSVIDLDSGTAVTDIDGSNIAFTVPSDLEKTFVVRNGVMLSRSGTVSRDYTLVSATGVLTLASALTSDESLMVYKLV